MPFSTDDWRAEYWKSFQNPRMPSLVQIRVAICRVVGGCGGVGEEEGEEGEEEDWAGEP